MNGGGGWGIFNHLLGWQNSATYGSVISHNLYWLVVIISFLALSYREKRGKWPLMKKPTNQTHRSDSDTTSEGKDEAVITEAGKAETGVTSATRDISA